MWSSQEEMVADLYSQIDRLTEKNSKLTNEIQQCLKKYEDLQTEFSKLQFENKILNIKLKYLENLFTQEPKQRGESNSILYADLLDIYIEKNDELKNKIEEIKEQQVLDRKWQQSDLYVPYWPPGPFTW